MTRFPLTDFIVAMLRADPATIRRADPAKLAAKYEIEPHHAAGYLAHHCGSPMSPVRNEGVLG
jgi:hypothetical protein